MAEIIETQELPVTITKVKIGKKDLTQKLIVQIPKGLYVSHIGKKGGKENKCYGLPLKIDSKGLVNDLIFDTDTPYEIDGKLLGYINISQLVSDITSIQIDENYISELKDVDDYGTTEPVYFLNYLGSKYFIIWIDKENNLRKGFIDQWTVNQLGLKLEQIFI